MFKHMGMEDYSQTNVCVSSMNTHSQTSHNRIIIQSHTHTHIQIIGTERSYGQESLSPREVMLWLAVKHRDRNALQVFSREIAPAGTGMAPGFAMLVGGRPKVYVKRMVSF